MRDALAAEAESGRKWTLLARLVRPQGRHGEILADILTDFPERFAERKRLFLLKADGTPLKYGTDANPREVTLERHWLHKGRAVLKFEGIDSINDAEPLRGLEVAIPSEERATLEEDAVYIDDLIGCRVFDLRGVGAAEGRDVGEIVEVDRESTAHPLLVVRGSHGSEVLIPFVKAFLVKVDVPAKRIEMDLPEGLLELNAPLTPEERGGRQKEQNAGETD
jgi:16S rRNA processing protein RimM